MRRNTSLISCTLSLVSLGAMVGVLWWHSICGSQMEEFLVPLLCTWSVPWFFFVSGIFFRHSIERKSLGTFSIGKVRSLVVPYLLWCVIGCLISCWVSPERITIVKLFGLLGSPQWNRALWYLRALIFFCFLGVVLYWFVSRLKMMKWTAFVLMFVPLVLVIHKYVIYIYGPNSSPIYFVLGIALSEKVLRDWRWGRHESLIGAACLLVAFSFRLIWFGLGYRFSIMGGTFWSNCSTVFLIVGLLVLVRKFAQRLCAIRLVSYCCSLTAFVYFMHKPINIVLKGIMPEYNAELRFVTFAVLSPVVYLAVGFAFKKCLPKAYAILSGGR